RNMKVACVQITPMAAYNFCHFDVLRGTSSNKPVVVLDMGAENTTLIVCTKEAVWQRSIRIGGNAFTQAIADAFKLSFRKAEKLKRTAPMSKYVRQIFTAMKPVFTDLGSEVQRSLGFYANSGSGRDVGFSKIVVLGGGMKLQGVAKYLQQSLGIAVVKPSSFRRLSVAQDSSSAKFHENISDFGVAYGLGVQLLGEGKIDVNLLPKKLARTMTWVRKGKMFSIAAGILLIVSVLGLVNALANSGKYKKNESVRRQISRVVSAAQKADSNLKKEKSKSTSTKGKITEELEVFKYRDIIPIFHQMLVKCLPNAENNPGQADLYAAFGEGDIEGVKSVEREDRKLAFVTALSINYAASLKEAKFGEIRKAKRKTKRRSTSDTEYMDPMMGMMGPMGGMMGPGGGGGANPYAAMMMQQRGAKKKEEGDGSDNPGFVVTLEGYTPYAIPDDLLDPSGVGDDQSKWGMVTRFANLSKLIDGCQFELFEKSDISHFKLETGPVDIIDTGMPDGIGVEREVERLPKVERRAAVGMMDPMMGMMGGMMGGGGLINRSMTDRVSKEDVLFDPMTNEEMSKTFDLVTIEDIKSDPSLSDRDIATKKRGEFSEEPLYITRDHWFRINAKFVWKESPNFKEKSESKSNSNSGIL
ncbi:MAG: pilus assembly protein PilM, partial [Planctomycetes bacterium]|nr:pilus assembly protein PilM [Planctomycetota bacterium]